MEDRKRAIGARIKEARKKEGLTLKQLGEFIGRTESLVARYEKGKVEIPLSMIDKLSAALGVDANYLLYGDDFLAPHREKQIAEYMERLQQSLADMKPDERLSLLSALEIAITQSTAATKDNDKMIKRLGDIIAGYGQMISSSNEFWITYVRSPNDYLVFLRSYDKCIRLINEHKQDLTETAISRLDDPTKLKAMIYGTDEPEK